MEEKIYNLKLTEERLAILSELIYKGRELTLEDDFTVNTNYFGKFRSLDSQIGGIELSVKLQEMTVLVNDTYSTQ